MFGLTDILAITLNNSSAGTNNGLKRIFVEQPGSLTWICFLPWRTDLKTAQKYNLLPKKGNLIIYEIPDELLGSTPQLTLDAFGKIKQDFKEAFEEYGLINKDIAFCGLSAGNLPAFYLANRFKCKKLLAVCPTIKLGEGIFTAFAAQKIRKNATKNGYSSESYDDYIKDINVENNLCNLPNDISIHLARFDKFVPFSEGNKLVCEIKKIRSNVTVKKYNFWGHLLSLYFFGRGNGG